MSPIRNRVSSVRDSAAGVIGALRRRTTDSARTGPLPRVTKRPVTKPVLPVSDVAASADFYEHLGFTVTFYAEYYAWVFHDGFELFHLIRSEQPGGAGAYVHVADPDVWHVAMSALDGSNAVGDIGDRPWQMREFGVTDPDGNLVRFGTNL